jgi:hypothetical protein
MLEHIWSKLSSIKIKDFENKTFNDNTNKEFFENKLVGLKTQN